MDMFTNKTLFTIKFVKYRIKFIDYIKVSER